MILRAIAEKLKRRSKDDFKGRHFEAMLITTDRKKPVRETFLALGLLAPVLPAPNPEQPRPCRLVTCRLSTLPPTP